MRKVKLASFDPATFSVVMASGIVALACWQFADVSSVVAGLATLLHWCNTVIFTGLLVVSLWRNVRCFNCVIADFSDHRRAFGMFAVIAACGVLGSGFQRIVSFPSVAVALWWLALVLWFVITYGVFAGITTSRHKPNLREGLQGSWLLSVVATQAMVIFSIGLVDELPWTLEQTLLFSYTLWCTGGMLYVVLISLIFYRYCFEPIDEFTMTPPYWINMGAMAISTLAGTTLISVTTNNVALQILPFVKGVTLLFWATATWWIPLLTLLGFWRHVMRRTSFQYDLRYWSIVFPLGMYSVASFEMYRWLGMTCFYVVAASFAAFALLAWLITSIGLVRWSLTKAAVSEN